jgi:lysophospholipase L1-like esterase
MLWERCHCAPYATNEVIAPVMSSPSATSDAPQSSEDRTAAALRRLLGVALTLAVAVALTYVVPGLKELRPWLKGDDAPLSSLFAKWGAGLELPGFAGAGGGYKAPEQVRDQVAKDLGDAVASNLGHAAGVKDEAQAKSGSSPSRKGPQGPGVHIDPSEYEDIDVGIYDPNDEGMRPFYEALLETAKDEDGALTRIGHYGDSSIATDLITHTVRRRMQKRFGDGGHGFVLIARGKMPWGHRDVEHRADDQWELKEVVRRELGDEGWYGYGGVQYRGMSGAHALFGTAPPEESPVGHKVSRFEIYYQEGRRGGIVRLQVDDGEYRKLDTRADEKSDAFEVIDVPDGAHELELRVMRGQPVLYGVALEREVPGVVYDSLGLVGARAKRLLNFDQKHIARQIEHRDLNLLILGFGGNEADSPIERMQDYESEFEKVIRHMRGDHKDMACLVFAPLDQAHKNEYGRVVTMETVPHIVQAQKEAAEQTGCAFFNTFQAMGGKGAMIDWYRSRPQLAMGDFRHATPAGYEVLGNMFYKALLKGFAGYLEARADKTQ